jgi:DeoR/GlpR family transcriptional regulator of sugar metabolism
VAHDSSLLVDSTKFASSALHRVVELSEFDAIYVDDGLSPDVVAKLSRGSSALHIVREGAIR